MKLECGLTLSNTWLPSLELCRTSSWLNLFNFSLHPSLPVLSNYQQHVFYIPAVLSFFQLCDVITEEGSQAEMSYILHAIYVKCLKELINSPTLTISLYNVIVLTCWLILKMKLYSNERNSLTPVRQMINHVRCNHCIHTRNHITTSLIPGSHVPSFHCLATCGRLRQRLGITLRNHVDHICTFLASGLQWNPSIPDTIGSQHSCLS